VARLKSSPTRLRYAVFAAIPSLLCLLLLAAAYRYLTSEERAQARGQKVNRGAWELSFIERGLPVPKDGSRTGYWGKRLKTKAKVPALGWREQEIYIKGLLDVDAGGVQHYESGAVDPARVLIVGGSVAFGSYSSRIQTTYFHLLGELLVAAGTPADVDVLASGAWKAVQEVRALDLYLEERKPPDVVVLYDGLNDLTVGATSGALYDERVPLPKGEKWTRTYHAHDYDRRVEDYLDLVRLAAERAERAGSRLLVVLQPSLAERTDPTPAEQSLLAFSLQFHTSAKALRDAYQAMRAGLAAFEREGLLTLLDASRAFEGEAETVFADMWQYADVGHRIVAERMATVIAALLREGAAPPLARGRR
jgi:hypothetical protein